MLLLAAVVLLLAIGALVVYSTTTATPREGLFARHLVYLVAGFGVLVAAAVFPYRYLDLLAYPLYGFSILLLLLVMVIGDSVLGGQRWISLGPVSIQPSELAKMATLLVLARFFASARSVNRPITVLRACALVLVPMALVLKQPDLGTALAFACLFVVMLHWSGAPLSWLLGAGTLGVTGLLTFRFPALVGGGEAVSGTVTGGSAVVSLFLLWLVFLAIVCGVLLLRGRRRGQIVSILALHLAVGLASPQLWNALEEYQRLRVLTFLSPDRDPSGAGYQVIQSKIAIGSGALFGKGFLQGSQKGLAYLPEQHTDFAFSALGEEFGLFGAGFVVLLFLVVLLRGLRIAHLARDRFASFLAAGTVGLLTYHIVVNWFMTMGFAPVTGLPLPFISFGGSFLLVTMALIGILQGIAMRRHTF